MQRILFFGELPPKTIHGASISNSTNIEMLKEKYLLNIIEEHFNIKEHETVSFRKITTFLIDWLKFFKISILKKHEIFYGVVYLSTIGICKNIILSTTFKLFNPNSKIILHFHRSDFNFFKRKKINNFLFKFLNLFINRYIVLSNNEKINFKKQSNIFVLNNTIEEEIKHKELIKIEKGNKYGLHVTYIGNFIVEKGIYELVNAIKEVNKNGSFVKLHLFGEYSSSFIKKSLSQLIENDQNIEIFPIISGIPKFNEIYNSDLMVLPSYNEGLPLILLESLYIGVPIIISNVGYVSDVLGENYPLFCEPKSAQSIISAINKYTQSEIGNLNKQVIQNYYRNYSHNYHRRQLFDIFNFNQSSI